jgi:hypothetical protein
LNANILCQLPILLRPHIILQSLNSHIMNFLTLKQNIEKYLQTFLQTWHVFSSLITLKW